VRRVAAGEPLYGLGGAEPAAFFQDKATGNPLEHPFFE
jgi:hypothetical protein